MLRIGQIEPTATADGKYTDGNVAAGVKSTRLRGLAFTAIQEEICHVIESAGMALDKSRYDQLHDAIAKIIDGAVPKKAGDIGAFSKEESDKKYQPAGRYQPAGNYEAKGHAYSKDESDRRYLSHDTSIPPAANLSGYATQQWVGANYPSRNEVASDERIVKGPALKYIDGNPTTSVSIPSGGFLLRMSINNHQYDMQYGFIQRLVGSNWITITERTP